MSLKTKQLGIRTLPSKQLVPLWLGPFMVSIVINHAYQIELLIHSLSPWWEARTTNLKLRHYC